MKYLKYIVLLIMFILPCCSPAFFQPIKVGVEYKKEIEHWQERIRKEGWTENIVNDIIQNCIRLSLYESEDYEKNNWKLPKEFIKDGFRGDCEDIMFFCWGTLKKLEYPNEIRGMAIRMPLGDHAILKVKLPNNKWKTYNPVPIIGDFLDIAMSRKIVEWNETKIFY